MSRDRRLQSDSAIGDGCLIVTGILTERLIAVSVAALDHLS
jgi:hypothetical protein